MHFKFILTAILSTAGLYCSGQDTLLLMNGKELAVKIMDDSGARIFFEAEKKNGRLKDFDIHKSEIFSVRKGGEEESILYVKDPDIGLELSVEDMRFYMSGQNDARYGFKTWPIAATGFAAGVGAVFYMEGGYSPFLATLIFPLGAQIPYIKIPKSSISNPKHALSEYYVEGYNKTARSKKFIHTFLATFAGVAAGSVVYELSQK